MLNSVEGHRDSLLASHSFVKTAMFGVMEPRFMITGGIRR